MKKRNPLIIIGLILLGGITVVFAVLDHPRIRGARWDLSNNVWGYAILARRPLKVSYDLTDASEYRDEHRQFSFKYPKQWKVERLPNGTNVQFYVKRNTLLWAPERQLVFSLFVDEQPVSEYLSITEKDRYSGIEQKNIQFFGRLPWFVYNLPSKYSEKNYYPYPKGVLEFGSWRLIVRHFNQDIFKTFRYDDPLIWSPTSAESPKWREGYEPPPRIISYVHYGSTVDSSLWVMRTFPEFGLTFKYPPMWNEFRFVKSDTAQDVWRKEKLFGQQKGQHYSGFLAEGEISIYVFTDDYNGWQDEGSQYFYPPITLADPEVALAKLMGYFSFFETAILENSNLGKNKVLRTFETRGYGESNIAVTYFIPQASPNLNIYVVVDLNNPVDLEVIDKPYISSADLHQLLQDQKVREKISLADEIVRNISTMK